MRFIRIILRVRILTNDLGIFTCCPLSTCNFTNAINIISCLAYTIAVVLECLVNCVLNSSFKSCASNRCRCALESKCCRILTLSYHVSSLVVSGCEYQLSVRVSALKSGLLNVVHHCRYEDSCQDTNDCDYDYELYECKALAV